MFSLEEIEKQEKIAQFTLKFCGKASCHNNSKLTQQEGKIVFENYSEIKEKADKAREEGNHKKAFLLSLLSLEYLTTKSGEIADKEPSTVEYCFDYFAALREKTLILNLIEELDKLNIDSSDYQILAQESIEKANYSAEIVDMVNKNPGIEFEFLISKIGLDNEKYNNIIKIMEGLGVVDIEVHKDRTKIYPGEEEVSFKEMDYIKKNFTLNNRSKNNKNYSGCFSLLFMFIFSVFVFCLYLF